MDHFFSSQHIWLKSLPRTEFWDQFFLFCNYFDTLYFPLILIPFIWFGISRKWGIRIFYLLALSGFINLIGKALFELPRPGLIEPELSLIKITHSYGFPSGAAQTAIFLGCLLLRLFPTLRAYFVAIIYVLTISFSRLYLKVHYPIDILGGWTLGLLGFWFYAKKERSLDHFLQKRQPWSLGMLGLLFPLTLIFLYYHPANLQIMIGTIGVTTGLLIFPSDPFYQPKLIKGLLAVFLVFLVAIGLKAFSVPIYWSSFFLGFWIAGITPLFFARNRTYLKKV